MDLGWACSVLQIWRKIKQKLVGNLIRISVHWLTDLGSINIFIFNDYLVFFLTLKVMLWYFILNVSPVFYPTLFCCRILITKAKEVPSIHFFAKCWFFNIIIFDTYKIIHMQVMEYNIRTNTYKSTTNLRNSLFSLYVNCFTYYLFDFFPCKGTHLPEICV